MALSLGVSVGDKIAVGDTVVEVRAIHFPKTMVVMVDGGKEFTVDDNVGHSVEILPNVRVYVGIGPGKHSSANRLAFEAPKAIPIKLLSTPNTADSKKGIASAATASNVALLAPVPREHLADGLYTAQTKGRVAFGSMKWETFRELDRLRKGMPVDVYIYESDGIGKTNSKTTWRGRYCFHKESEMGAPPADIKPFRPDSTFKYEADNQGHWAVFWVLDSLEKVTEGKEVWVGEFTGYRKGKAYGHSFSPEGPLLIEHPRSARRNRLS
jgi:hypothetical protein